MSTITVKVDDQLIKAAGLQTIKDFIKEQVEVFKFQMLSDSIMQSIKDSDINLEEDLIKAKRKAWEKYKKEYLGDILI